MNASRKSADVAIIGGGLHGCSTALHLGLAGLHAMVIEKDYIGRHASGVNAGGVRRLGRHFAEIPLAVSAGEIWHHIEDWVDDTCGFVPSGQVLVAETEDEMLALSQRAGRLREMGFDHEEVIDGEDLRLLLPAISPHCVGALAVRGDGHANPFRTVRAFKAKAETLGAGFLEGTRVLGLDRRGGHWHLQTTSGPLEAPVLVNCAGAWGGEVAALLGEPVPIAAEAPMLMITARMPAFVGPVVGAQGRALSFKQFENGTVLIGGGKRGEAVPGTNITHLDFQGLADSARTAAAIFPIMGAARIVRAWAGIEGCMPDEIPVIGASSTPDAFHAFGFSAHGFQLGPLVGGIIADLVTKGETALPIEPFSIERFRRAS
jgi:sarcosine oxidase subunit beta